MIKTLLAATALTLSPIADESVQVAKGKDNADLLIVGLTFSAVIATLIVLSSKEDRPVSP
jgi:hypothetical protein